MKGGRLDIEAGLLPEKEVASKTGLTISKLWRMRRANTGIPFIKLSPERTGRIRYRLVDVEAYIAAHPKPAKRNVAPKQAAPVAVAVIDPVTLTCEEAARRHQGQTSLSIAKMCLKGKAIAKRYGGPSRVPEKVAQTVLFAVKLGKRWQVPVSELDRVFLGKLSR